MKNFGEQRKDIDIAEVSFNRQYSLASAIGNHTEAPQSEAWTGAGLIAALTGITALAVAVGLVTVTA